MSLQILIAIDLGRNGFPQGSQQRLSLIGDAAGERHHLGIEAVDDVGDTYGEVVDVPLHHGDGGRVPLLLGLKDGPAIHLSHLCGGGVEQAFRMLGHGLLRHADQTGGGSVGFKAAFSSAGAGCAAVLHHHVSQLCCTAGAARQDLTVQHHTAAYAGTKRQDHGAVHILSAARYYLAQRGGVGVIGQTDGITAVFLNGGPEIKIFPMEVGGVADDTAVILHNAGTAHAHAADRLGIVSFRQSCDQTCDLAGHVLRP